MVAGSVGILATSSSDAAALNRAQHTLNTSTGTTLYENEGEDGEVTSNGQWEVRNHFQPGPAQVEPIRDTVQAWSGWWMFES
jgi:hypothetical protein